MATADALIYASGQVKRLRRPNGYGPATTDAGLIESVNGSIARRFLTEAKDTSNGVRVRRALVRAERDISTGDKAAGDAVNDVALVFLDVSGLRLSATQLLDTPEV